MCGLQRGPHFHCYLHFGPCPGHGDVSAKEFTGGLHTGLLTISFPVVKDPSPIPHAKIFLGAVSLKNLIDFHARRQGRQRFSCAGKSVLELKLSETASRATDSSPDHSSRMCSFTFPSIYWESISVFTLRGLTDDGYLSVLNPRKGC